MDGVSLSIASRDQGPRVGLLLFFFRGVWAYTESVRVGVAIEGEFEEVLVLFRDGYILFSR